MILWTPRSVLGDRLSAPDHQNGSPGAPRAPQRGSIHFSKIHEKQVGKNICDFQQKLVRKKTKGRRQKLGVRITKKIAGAAIKN